MAELIAALDIGGTKTQLIIEEVDGKRLVDITEPSLDWEAEPAHEAAEFIATRVARHTPAGSKIVALAFGAQGIDRPETAHKLEAALAPSSSPQVPGTLPASPTTPDRARHHPRPHRSCQVPRSSPYSRWSRHNCRRCCPAKSRPPPCRRSARARR